MTVDMGKDALAHHQYERFARDIGVDGYCRLGGGAKPTLSAGLSRAA